MMNLEDFEGDVLLSDTVEGGEITIINGLVIADKSFSTALYLSLFGGNGADGGKVDTNRTWWGNRLEGTKEDEKLVSRFQSIIRDLPLTSKNLELAQEAVLKDLDWMKSEGIADEITADISALDNQRIDLTVIIKKSSQVVDRGNWTVNWEAANNGI